MGIRYIFLITFMCLKFSMRNFKNRADEDTPHQIPLFLTFQNKLNTKVPKQF